MDDGLSQKICSNCLAIIKAALQFRRASKKAEKALLESVSPTKLKRKYKLRKRDVKTKVKTIIEDDIGYDMFLDIGYDDFQNEPFDDVKGETYDAVNECRDDDNDVEPQVSDICYLRRLKISSSNLFIRLASHGCKQHHIRNLHINLSLLFMHVLYI
jgi:hypothetical protein